jgi:phage terminase large subunit
MKLPKTYYDVKNSRARYQVHEGGTRSGKTYSILTALAEICYINPNAGLYIDITRVNGPAIDAGPLRDWREILGRNGWLNERAARNPRCREYDLFGNTVSFFSVDQSYKMRGRKRDILFMNEANRFSYDAFHQLNMRTTKLMILDYNPDDVDHWIYDKILTRDNAQLFKSTYKDNPFLPKSLISEIEALQKTDNWYWRVYGLGERAANPAQIIRNYHILDALPKSVTDEAGRDRPLRPAVIGLDFGFSADPTAAIVVYEGLTRPNVNGAYTGAEKPELYLQEILYLTGLTNPEIANLIKDKIKENGLSKSIPIICDSAEPKSIEEIKRLGLNVWPATKGPDSVRQGLQFMQQFKMHVTRNSENIISEFKNYKWAQDKNGKTLNSPIDKYNHLIDAARYAIDYYYNKRYTSEYAIS